MKYKFYSCLISVISLTFLGLFLLQSPTSASAPTMEGSILYIRQDGTKTDTGVAGIWVEWTDSTGAKWYTKTDTNGKFVFSYLGGEGWEDMKRGWRKTWIKPSQPQSSPIIASSEDEDYSSQGYVRQYGPDIYSPNFGCGETPIQITAIQPDSWTGRFVESIPQEVEKLSELPKSLSGAAIGNIKFSNGTGTIRIGTYYYQATVISGIVTDSATQKPIANVEVIATDGQRETTGLTDTTGRFLIHEATSKSGLYAVRIKNVPPGYLNNPKTTTQTSNTPLGSTSYEQQIYGSNDCAGSAQNGPAGRCNFQLDPDPNASGNAGSGGLSDSGISNGDDEEFLDSGLNPLPCTPNPNLPIDIQTIRIKNQFLGVFDINNQAKIRLARQANRLQAFTLPITLTDKACKNTVKAIKFVYQPSPNSSSSAQTQPDPQPCNSSSNRADNCSCTQNSDCFGNKCDIVSGIGICKTPPRIETTGGDVHSNESINIGGD